MHQYGEQDVVAVFEYVFGDQAQAAIEQAVRSGHLVSVGQDEAGRHYFDPFAVEELAQQATGDPNLELPKDYGDGNYKLLSETDTYEDSEEAAPEDPLANAYLEEVGGQRIRSMWEEAQGRYGRFDESVAAQAAQHFLAQGFGGEEAVEQGAQYAAQMARSTFDAYRQGQTTEAPQEFSGKGRQETYQDVVDRWAGERADGGESETSRASDLPDSAPSRSEQIQEAKPGVTYDDVTESWQAVHGEGGSHDE